MLFRSPYRVHDPRGAPAAPLSALGYLLGVVKTATLYKSPRTRRFWDQSLSRALLSHAAEPDLGLASGLALALLAHPSRPWP